MKGCSGYFQSAELFSCRMPMRSASSPAGHAHGFANGIWRLVIIRFLWPWLSSPLQDKIDDCKDANQGSYANKDLDPCKVREPMYPMITARIISAPTYKDKHQASCLAKLA